LEELSLNSNKSIVAVYGTLKVGHGNHRLLAGSDFLGKTVVYGKMYSLGAFPAVVLGGHEKVYVELYSVDDDTLARLDRLEGCPSFYQRSSVYAPSYGEIFIYTMEEGSSYINGAHRIESGNWGG
jgi:gamma-glutamylcyclotransferase (GGCT)/AIG2-like uncharacterized protein YtfP